MRAAFADAVGVAPLRKLLGYPDERHRVLVLGLHASGKTSCVCRMQGELTESIRPTTGFNVTLIVHDGTTLEMWDVGGNDRWVRPLNRHYLPNTQAVVLVVDSTDLAHVGCAEATAERWDESVVSMLRQLLAEAELLDVPFLVLANKSDLPNAMPAEVRIRLDLDGLMARSQRRWHITSSSAVTGDGLHAALDWVVNAIRSKRSAPQGTLLPPPVYRAAGPA